MLDNNLPGKTILLMMAFMAFLMAACTPDTSGPGDILADRPGSITDEITMYVGPELVDCVGVAPQTCLQVKFSPDDEWQLLYEGIEGFEHQAGIESELRVNKITAINQPADVSAIRYELVEIVSQSENQTAVMDTLDELLETDWNLVTMNGEAPVADSQPTISFDPDGINGTTGCNSFFGGYTLDGTVLTIGQVGQTEMFCENTMDQEQTYLTMLMSAVSLTLEDQTLTIHTSEGDLVYQPATDAELEGHTWHLSGIADGNGGILYTWIDERITAEFVDGRLTGSAGCNAYGTEYETTGSTLTLGEITSTLIGCEEGEVMARENEFLAALANIASYEISRDNLTLFDAEGSIVITFSATVPEA